jgi:UDPglucose 6-dehydrogenase
MVRIGIGTDARIGSKFLYPGIGYGGSCFPKDVKALIKTAETNGHPMRILKAVEEVNEDQKLVLFNKLKGYFSLKNTELSGKTISIWGLSFKPETDDMREAPSLLLINKLLAAGCCVRVYDPVAMSEARHKFGDAIIYAKDIYDAALGSDALLLLTEWKEFRLPSWNAVNRLMNRPVVFDGRNIYQAQDLFEAGFDYFCIGKVY